MTSTGDRVDVRILGPLEIRGGDDALALGGAKQRTVLATLLLRVGDIVSVEQLMDELWGESPPASAAHTLEVYVSRLRQLLTGYGPQVLRRGSGYVLDAANASLDAREFVALAEDVSRAAAAGDPELVATRGREALALWHGPALADVALGPLGRADVERLEELRLRTLELRIEADLELGHHDGLVAELQALVARNPYRERLVVQLMLALYRSGRHAEALDVYEQTRRRLDADLGLQPSTELQLLSARIVRQEPELTAAPRQRAVPPADAAPRRERRRHLSGLVAVGVAVAAVMALTASGSASHASAADAWTPRIALVLQRGSPVSAFPDWRNRDLENGLYDVIAQRGLDAELIELDDSISHDVLERTARQLATGGFDLALYALNAPSARAFAPVAAGLDGMRSVFIDASLTQLGVQDARNVTAIRFAIEQPSLLAGALSGLVAPRGGEARRPDVVSVVAGRPTPETKRAVAAFEKGFARARPNGRVIVGYTHETVDPTACELLANRQIDAGSDVVFVHAGRCGSGALAVSRTRDVWAIASDGIGAQGDNVLAGMFKDWDNALFSVLHAHADGSLSTHRDIVLGLDGYNVGLEMAGTLPASLASKVVELCSDVRTRSTTTIPTYAEP